MNRQLRNNLGYIPIVAGFILIAVGVIILVAQVVMTNALAIPNWYFWFYWAPIIAVLLIAGAISTITGLLIQMKTRNILSYALVAGGFLVVIFDSYFLVGDWVRDYVNSMGISNFYPIQAGGFFSWLMTGVFLVIFGIILASRVRSRWGITSIAGGSVLLFLAFCLIALDVITTIAIDPVYGLQDFRWYFFWDNFTPAIPLSLVMGCFFVFLGVILIRKRKTVTD